jgi:hypothetical protein
MNVFLRKRFWSRYFFVLLMFCCCCCCCDGLRRFLWNCGRRSSPRWCMSEYGSAVDWCWQGKIEGLEEDPVRVPLYHIPTWTALVANPVLRGENPETNRLSSGTALLLLYCTPRSSGGSNPIVPARVERIRYSWPTNIILSADQKRQSLVEVNLSRRCLSLRINVDILKTCD